MEKVCVSCVNSIEVSNGIEETILHGELFKKRKNSVITAWKTRLFVVTCNTATDERHFSYMEPNATTAIYSCKVQDLDVYIINDHHMTFNITCENDLGRKELILRAKDLPNFDLWITCLPTLVDGEKKRINELKKKKIKDKASSKHVK